MLIRKINFQWLLLSFALLFSPKAISANLSIWENTHVLVSQFFKDTANKTKEVLASVIDKTQKFERWAVEQTKNLDEDVPVFWQFFFAFLAGLSVSFTPCIYPLIPITVGILGARSAIGIRRQVLRSIFYLLGVCMVFATLGFLAMHFNWIFGAWAGNKWVILATVGVFAFLALNMLDVFELEYSLTIKAPEVTSVFSAFVYGMVSGLITSPCMTPVLSALLSFVAQQNNQFLGFMLLFSFALGMTFLVLLFSSFTNLLRLMPKPGFWMVEFRHLLGFGVLFLCIKFLNPLISVWQHNLLVGILWGFIFFYYFFSSKKESVTRIIRAHQEQQQNNGDLEEVYIGIAEFISPSFFFKKLISLVALFLAVFYVGKSYLSYKHTRLRSVLIKLIR